MSSIDQAPTGNQLAPAQNPQGSTSAETLAAPSTTSLQTGASDLLNASENVSISSVGDSHFTPISNTPTTTQPLTASKPADHHYPVIFGGAFVIVACIVACVVMARMSLKTGKY